MSTTASEQLRALRIAESADELADVDTDTLELALRGARDRKHRAEQYGYAGNHAAIVAAAAAITAIGNELARRQHALADEEPTADVLELRALRRVEARDRLADSPLEELRSARRAASRRFQTAKEIHGRRSVHAIAARDAHNRISAEIARQQNAPDEHSGSRRAEILEAEAPHLIAPAVDPIDPRADVDSLTAAELEQLATDHPETAGAVVAELARRLEELEQLEAQLLPIGGIQRRTRSEPAAAALEIVLRVIRTNSPHRRRILRKIG